MSVSVRVPKGKGPEINVTQHAQTRTFKVSSDDVVECDSQADANFLVRLIDGASIVDQSAPVASGSTTSKGNA